MAGELVSLDKLESYARLARVAIEPRLPATMPAAERMQIGEVSPFDVTPESPLGLKISELVKAARMVAGADEKRRAKFSAMTFAEYLDAVERWRVVKRDIERNQGAGYAPEVWRFVLRLFDAEKHTPDFESYVQYVANIDPGLGDAVFRAIAATAPVFRAAALREHSVIVGGTGAGKSELTKLLIHHYVSHPELGAVVVLDPHGDLASQVAHWREFSGAGASRLAYLDANLGEGFVPAINPLVCKYEDGEERARVSDQIARALVSLAEKGDELTGNMVELARCGVRVLLDKPGSHLGELVEGLLIQESKKNTLMKRGLEHEDEAIRDHYRLAFSGVNFAPSRLALARRVKGPLYFPKFRAALKAENPIDLESLLDAGKVVVINCGSMGTEETADAFGRFITAQIAAIGQRRNQRAQHERKPVHVFIDEATRLLTPTIFKMLLELRKVRISLCLVQQNFGVGADTDQKRSMRNNTEVKMLGRSGSLGGEFKELGWRTDDVPRLERGEWIVGYRDGEMLKLKTASHLADNSNAMSDEEWSEVREYQLGRYYRQISSLPQDETSDEADGWER